MFRAGSYLELITDREKVRIWHHSRFLLFLQLWRGVGDSDSEREITFKKLRY